jgi:hypothetical protein
MSAAARETLPFDLYQKAKRHFWDPRAFGVRVAETVEFATAQVQSRMRRIAPAV